MHVACNINSSIQHQLTSSSTPAATGIYTVHVLTLAGHDHGRVGVVRFDARGISGYIKFTEVEGNIRIEANLQGLTGAYPSDGLNILIGLTT